MDVARGANEVIVVVDRNRSKAAAKQRSVAAMAFVEEVGVTRPDALHRRRGRPGRSNEQVVVVAHRAVGVQLEELIAGRLGQETLERKPVAISHEHRIVIDPPVHHMQPAVGVVDAWWIRDVTDRMNGVSLGSATSPQPVTSSRRRTLQQRGEFDGAVALDAVAGALDHVHGDLGLAATGFGHIVVVDDR